MTSRSLRYEWYDTTVPEIKAFVGVLLLMGIHKLPSIADCWSTHKYLGIPNISAVFPANHFNHLSALIHFNDNSAAKPCGDQVMINYIKLDLLLRVFYRNA